MSLATCEKVLRSGRLLTASDVAAQTAGSRSGPEFDRALEAKLGRFYKARVHLESLLLFDGAAKYAALHVGGEGPAYGHCCVLFEKMGARDDSTCFAGDTITTVFDADGNLAGQEPADVLRRFATRQEVWRLGSVAYEEFLTDGHPSAPLDVQRLQDLLCEKDTLIEIHIHGDLLAEDIQNITIARKVGRGVAKKLRQYERASDEEKKQMQYDEVRTYLALYQLAEKRGIPVLEGL